MHKGHKARFVPRLGLSWEHGFRVESRVDELGAENDQGHVQSHFGACFSLFSFGLATCSNMFQLTVVLRSGFVAYL